MGSLCAVPGRFHEYDDGSKGTAEALRARLQSFFKCFFGLLLLQVQHFVQAAPWSECFLGTFYRYVMFYGIPIRFRQLHGFGQSPKTPASQPCRSPAPQL